MLKKYGLFTFIMLSISVATVFLFNNVLTPEKKLPIYQPNMVKFQLVDSTVQHVKRFHKIDNFKSKFYLIKTNSSPSLLNGAYAVAFGSKSSSLSRSSGISGRFIFK